MQIKNTARQSLAVFLFFTKKFNFLADGTFAEGDARGERHFRRNRDVVRFFNNRIACAAHRCDAAVRVVRGKRDMPQRPFDRRVRSICKNFEQSAAALSGRDIPPLPPFAERWDTAVRQVELSAQYQNERVAMLQARHHLCWYLKGISHANYYKEKIVQLSTLSELHALSASIKRDLR